MKKSSLRQRKHQKSTAEAPVPEPGQPDMSLHAPAEPGPGHRLGWLMAIFIYIYIVCRGSFSYMISKKEIDWHNRMAHLYKTHVVNIFIYIFFLITHDRYIYLFLSWFGFGPHQTSISGPLQVPHSWYVILFNLVETMWRSNCFAAHHRWWTRTSLKPPWSQSMKRRTLPIPKR